MRRTMAVLLLAVLFFQACSQATQTTDTPEYSTVTPKPTIAEPTPSAQPIEQAEALIVGEPPIPKGMPQYSIRIEIDYVGHAFKGYSRVDYTNREDEALERLVFRLYPNMGQSYGDGKISIDSARVNGQPAVSTLSLSDSVVEVKLVKALNPGEKAQAEFEFSGTVPVDFGEAGSGYGIYNLSEGVLALANFYPILAVYEDGGWRVDPVYTFGDAVYSDAALYRVEVLVGEDVLVVTSGMEVGQEDVDGKVLYHYITGPARDFFIIASTDFQVASQKRGETTVNSYYLPRHASGGEQALDTAVQALETFTQEFGAYPYKEYDVVEAPLDQAGGVEYPGMGLIAEKLYAEPNSAQFKVTIAHEVAHQWWYNVVGNDVIRDPWMDEALATYSSILYWEQAEGTTAKDQIIGYYRDGYERTVQEGMDAPVTEGMPYFQEDERGKAYGPVVYGKGGLFFEELRAAIGDEAFFKAIEDYYQAHWFSIASTDELLAAFQKTSAIPLDELYQQWLYSPEVGKTAQP